MVMSRRAWVYVAGIILLGVMMSGLAIVSAPADLSPSVWTSFATLTVLTTSAQLFKARGPKHEAWHANLVFLFAGALLLPPALVVLLVAIPHLIEWSKERLVDAPSLRNWYIQPFNIATHIVAGLTTHSVYMSLTEGTLATRYAMLTALLAATTYVVVNHALIGQALVLARGISWRESGVMAVENVVTDLVLLFMGYGYAIMWTLDPWLILAALAPLVVTYRALLVPQLKQEATTDQKTGLLNAQHFARRFEEELGRVEQFNHPIAVIMADLDLLRNINNTFGHLAGDVVLIGIAQIIRDNIRAYDIAGRFGGEEFSIVLLESEPETARAFAERLRTAVENARFEVDTSPTPIHHEPWRGMLSSGCQNAQRFDPRSRSGRLPGEAPGAQPGGDGYRCSSSNQAGRHPRPGSPEFAPGRRRQAQAGLRAERRLAPMPI